MSKFQVGDRVRVVQHLAGDMDHNIEHDAGIVIAILPRPNPATGVYPGVVYSRDENGKTVVALDGELEKVE